MATASALAWCMGKRGVAPQKGADAGGAWPRAAIMLHLPEVKGAIKELRRHQRNHLQLLLSGYDAVAMLVLNIYFFYEV